MYKDVRPRRFVKDISKIPKHRYNILLGCQTKTLLKKVLDVREFFISQTSLCDVREIKEMFRMCSQDLLTERMYG